MARKNKYESLYGQAETFLTVNDDDKDLISIRISLPQPPSYKDVIGYGLEPKKQKWVREPIPPKLEEIQNSDDFETIDDIWDYLSEHQDELREEIAFIERQWEYRNKGCWFFNNGIPTYITGDHWFFLSTWKMDGRFADYRSRDRKWYVALDYFQDDPQCLGLVYPKHRREGATSRTQCWLYQTISKEYNQHGGMQSMTEDHATGIFQNHLVQGWKRQPFWFQPVHEGTTSPKKQLRFFNPARIGGGGKSIRAKADGALDSYIDYGPSSVGAYDTYKLRAYHGDEVGKCLGINTPVRIIDGSIKMSQDVIPGDILMGPDSNGRTVSSVTTGRERSYLIIPNKGDSWQCNASHVLSLKVSCSRGIKGVEKGGVLNISVADYLSLSKRDQKHLTLYRVGVDYSPRAHSIPPYILGLWLGDGDKKDQIIFNVDNEITDELRGFCNTFGYELSSTQDTRTGCFSHRLKSGQGKTGFLEDIKQLGLYREKRIPNEYLIDSEESRLQLLAGIIDTDGYLSKKKGKASYFEITQVRKDLAEDIRELALSLGFWASLKMKGTSMTRKDGTTYRGTAYQVTIFGDLYRIPTKVARKVAEKFEYHKNRRDPLKTGFQVAYVGEQDYYGFTLKEDPLFLLGDYIVTHNTKEVDVNKRHTIVKQCLTLGGGIIINGFAVYTSTVGEMDKGGGKNFQMMCNQSHYDHWDSRFKRNKNGQTISGCYVLFIPAYDGLEGFIDEYGNSVIGDPTPEQAKFIGRDFGAKEYLENIRKQLREAEDMEGLSEQIRMYPCAYRECFWGSAKNINFNAVILQERLAEFQLSNPYVQSGNFEWTDGPDSTVEWVPSPEGDYSGRFRLSHTLAPEQTNRFYRDGNIIVPGNTQFFVAGADPFKFKTTSTGRKSMAGGAVFMKHNMTIDNPARKSMDEYETHRFVCTYLNRPPRKEIFGEDMIKMCVYFGCQIFPEINVPFIWDYFEQERPSGANYSGYLYYRVDAKTRKLNKTPGANTLVGMQESIFNAFHTYIEQHGRREVHDDLLQQCLDIEDDMGDFDLFTAGGYALVAATDRFRIQEEKTEEEGDSLDGYFQQFEYPK